MTRSQCGEVLILEMRGGGEIVVGTATPQPHLAGVVLQHSLVHVRAVGPVDHDARRGIAENQGTRLKHKTRHVSELSLQQRAPSYVSKEESTTSIKDCSLPERSLRVGGFSSWGITGVAQTAGRCGEGLSAHSQDQDRGLGRCAWPPVGNHTASRGQDLRKRSLGENQKNAGQKTRL